MDNSSQVGRNKLIQVFRYLEALNHHRNPARRQIQEQPWVFWLRDLPDHPCIQRGVFVETASPTDSSPEPGNDETQLLPDDFLLKVRRPELTRAPLPPDSLAGWLEPGWEDPGGEIRVKESMADPGVPAGMRTLRFDEAPQREPALESWRARWSEWAMRERPAREAMKLFEHLYDLHGRLEREAEQLELVLGDGILSWWRKEGAVFHPVLLQRLQLQFDPGTPEFTLLETEQEVELYSALFQSMEDVDGRAIARCREEIEAGGFHPLGGNSTSAFLSSLVVRLSPRGQYIGLNAPQEEKIDPQVGRDPVIFLRARTLGFAKAIEGVVQDLREREDLPSSLLRIVGVTPPAEEDSEPPGPGDSVRDPGSVLLSKPANPEQLRIAAQLDRHGCVLVQGPPGTGKTHTIANLIGHLLAQGQSILVTSHTAKALRIVREQVVPQLQPLCVSVLESDLDGKKQLESSVEAILERVTTSNLEQLNADAEALAERRRDLLSRLAAARERLVEARGDEYREIEAAGQCWSPSDAARKVASKKSKSGWIPRPVTPGANLPLSQAELAELYRTNTLLTPEDEQEMIGPLPPIEELIAPDELERLARERTKLGVLGADFRSDLWSRPPAGESADDLETLSTSLLRAVEPLQQKQAWQIPAIAAGKNGSPQRDPWDQLVRMIETLDRKASSSREVLLQHGPFLAKEIPLETQAQIAEEIYGHMKDGGKLGRFQWLAHPAWKNFVGKTRVASGPPRRIEHFYALAAQARLEMARQELAGRWDRQVGRLGAPAAREFGMEIERIGMQFAQTLRHCLDWYAETWKPLEEKLRSYGFKWETLLAEAPAVLEPDGDLLRLGNAISENLAPVLAARANALRLQLIEDKLDALRRKLDSAGEGRPSQRVVTELRDALKVINPGAYRQAFRRLVELHNKRAHLERRRDLLSRLEVSAPGWARSIRNWQGKHAGSDLPGDPLEAWTWRQLNDELERRSKVSFNELQKTMAGLSEEMLEVTALLADRRAWASQVERTTLAKRQALVGWHDTVRKMGRGFGKRVAELRAEAARKMTECRGAVPVWIMPLARVVENFDPQTTRFDVVIIDEASQCDVMALLALYLGEKVLVVGDHEQVSPVAVGQDLTVVTHLIDEHLQGIPNAILYDGQLSIYDLARQSFGGTTCLLEHFRCVPEIIQFSNHLSYDDRLKPLRDTSGAHLKPHIVSHRVETSRTVDKVNVEEARAVASLMVAATEQPEYARNRKGEPATMGVISLVGDEQAFEIDRLLRRHLRPDEYVRRRIVCGSAAQFQGDERDVMVLSLVDSSPGSPLPLRQQPLFKQRFNVAASRAREQMWVVYSLDPQTDLKAGDLRRSLIEHALHPQTLMGLLEQGESRPESELERLVSQQLAAAGYRVVPQWKVGHYRIDLVVEGAGRRLAVECDGDRRCAIERLGEDMERQAILERLGWTFVRVRGSEFFRDPGRALEPVFERLTAMEIPAEASRSDAALAAENGAELLERIQRRAAILRKEWESDEFLSPPPRRAPATANGRPAHGGPRFRNHRAPSAARERNVETKDSRGPLLD